MLTLARVLLAFEARDWMVSWCLSTCRMHTTRLGPAVATVVPAVCGGFHPLPICSTSIWFDIGTLSLHPR